MTDAFARLPRGRVLQYHNITPAHFFAPYDPGIFRLAALGRAGAARRSSARPTWRSATRNTTGGSSTRSASRNTGVFPIAIDPDRIRARAAAAGAREGARPTGC